MLHVSNRKLLMSIMLFFTYLKNIINDGFSNFNASKNSSNYLFSLNSRIRNSFSFFFLWVQKFNTIGIEKWKCENMDSRSENNNKVIAPPFCGMGI